MPSIAKAIVWLCAAMIIAVAAIAGVPQKMNYQATLAHSNGPPVTNTVEMTFTIWDASIVGTALWAETLMVTPTGVGQINLNLGEVHPITEPVLNGSDRWLGIKIGLDPEIAPRRELVTSAHAFHAAVADEALTVADNAVTSVKILDGTITFADISQNGATSGQIMKWNGSAWVAADDETGGGGGGWTDDGTVVRLDGVNDSVGIGTATPAEKLHVANGRLLMGTPYYLKNVLHQGDIVFDNGAAVDLPGLKFYYGDNKNFGIDLFDDAGGYLRFVEGLDEGGQTRMAIREGGNVGIGTLTPTEKLDVEGNIHASGTIISGNSITIDGVSDKITASTGTIDFDNENLVTTGKATIGPGHTNSGVGAFVAGGDNTVSHFYCTVGGGRYDTASGGHATVGGGFSNIASGLMSIISGGYDNTASAAYTTVGGGYINTAGSDHCTVGGGGENIASNFGATIAGGSRNLASGNTSTIGGGQYSKARGQYSVVAGGGGPSIMDSNTAAADWSTVSGGQRNMASASHGTVGGGYGNKAAHTQSTVGGGFSNLASGLMSTVGGGLYNVASGELSIVIGGQSDTASGRCSAVGGGNANKASGDYSFAAGRRAKATHDGAFVWGDKTTIDFSSTAINQFSVRATGGTRIFSNTGLTAGVTLAAGGSSWSAVSDSTLKENIRPVNGQDILDKIAQMPISRWNYKAQDSQIEHVGPMAQDFYRLFGLGEDDKHINTLDPDGIALAAIKALHAQNKEQTTEIDQLKEQVSILSTLVETLLAQRNMERSDGKYATVEE